MRISARTYYRLIVTFCILVPIVLLVVGAGLLVWQGFAGTAAQEWLQSVLRDWIPSKETIQIAASILGALGTAATAVFGIYKALRYAEANLPKRLQELLEGTEAGLLDNRTALILAAEVDDPNFKLKDSLLFVPHLEYALREQKKGQKEFAKQNFDMAVADLTDRLAVAVKQVDSLKQQLATSLVLRGKTSFAVAEKRAVNQIE